MCLITTQQIPFIAEGAMVVYKVLSKDRISPYNAFHYLKNKLYQTEILKSNDWCCFDNKDQDYLDTHYPDWTREKCSDLNCFGPGFHSALSSDRFQPNRHEAIFTCTIPKGSEYYLDTTGLCVSNQIIIL
jgi:hypothetical protein